MALRMTGLDTFYAWSLIVIPTLFIATFAADRAFRRLLRDRHPEILLSLGSSSPEWLRPMAKSLGFMRFVWTSRYEDFGDPELSRQAMWLKGLLAAYSLSFFLLLVVLITNSPAFSH